MSSIKLRDEYDLITLLIGVNNQYQGLDFDIYEREFEELIDLALSLVDNQTDKLRVLSIPDYAYTPFGAKSEDPEQISSDIDKYNAYALSVCEDQDIMFVDITDLTRFGLTTANLVAEDGLHPSSYAYMHFVYRLMSGL